MMRLAVLGLIFIGLHGAPFVTVRAEEFVQAKELPWVRVSDDRKYFVREPDGERMLFWGVNYDHDAEGNLLDEYWGTQWERVEDDFREMKALGANCVRVHLQIGTIMRTPVEADPVSLERLKSLVKLAQATGLYLNITGLACYHKANIPPWYDSLSEADRWDVQARFWEAVAQVCHESSAVFCYDLMNEPILPGKEAEKEWLTGELGGKYFVQRLSLDLEGRTREEVARAWVSKMVASIRKVDTKHLITVGVIPWVHVFGAGKPFFYSPEVGEGLDFVSVHFYPESGKVEKALEALRVYDVGRPLVIEEMFPLKCSADELIQFVDGSKPIADGWISFYWGETAEQLRSRPDKSIGHAITAQWIERFQSESFRVQASGAEDGSQ